MIVTAFNPEIDHLEKTYLSQDRTAGATVLYVTNNQNFTAAKKLLIGEMGYENAEVVTSGTITGRTDITVSATAFTHVVDDPVYLLEWDRIRFYRADSLTGTYNLLTTVDIDFDNPDLMTKYDDPTAEAIHYYKVSFFNSVTSNESVLSDPINTGGYGVTTAGKVIEQVARRVRDQNYTVLGIEEYLDIMNEVNNDLITQTHRPYRFLRTSVTLNTVPGQNYIALPSDLWKFDRVEFTHTIGTLNRSYGISPITMRQWDSQYNNGVYPTSDELMSVAVDEVNHRLYVGPTPKNGTTGKVELFYWRTFPQIDTVGDAVLTPNTLIYRYKMMSEYYAAKSESDNQFARLADKYDQKYGAEVVKMQRVNRLDAGTPRDITPPSATLRKRFYL